MPKVSIIPTLSLSLYTLLATGCHFGNSDLVPNEAQSLSVDHQNIIHSDQSILYQADSEVEAIAAVGPWLIWQEDEKKALSFAQISAQPLAAKMLPALDHDVDLICGAWQSEELINLVTHDGDSFFYQYWFNPSEATLVEVRRFASNPDIEACLLKDEQLIFRDPYLGPLSTPLTPESDGIIHPASAEHAALIHSIDALSPTLALDAEPIPHTLPTVHPVMETEPVLDSGDAADDPAILVGRDASLIAGTNKRRGLALYDLEGKKVAFSDRGRLNNVDAIQTNDNEFLLTASNRTHKSIDVFSANTKTAKLSFLYSIALPLDDPYGLCMARDQEAIHVFVGDSEGRVSHWKIDPEKKSGQAISDFDFDSQTEGCVYDTNNGQLYIGQEEKGIWKIDLATGQMTMIEALTTGHLTADIEGLDIYDGRYLVASSQGDDSYAIYQLSPWQFLTKFKVTANVALGIDGASETDGLAVTAKPMPGLPAGALVVQDGRNRAPMDKQNFKLIDWRHVEQLLNHEDNQ